jgi:hypothetical protein
MRREPVTATTDKNSWFLAGSLSPDPITRACTLKGEKDLFFPVINQVAFGTEPTDTEESLRQQNTDFLDSVLEAPDTETFVEVDGTKVSDQNIFRADTALFSVTRPELSGDEPVDAVGDGLWVWLPPLQKGKHTLHFGVSAPKAGFSQDITYTLKVV